MRVHSAVLTEGESSPYTTPTADWNMETEEYGSQLFKCQRVCYSLLGGEWGVNGDYVSDMCNIKPKKGDWSIPELSELCGVSAQGKGAIHSSVYYRQIFNKKKKKRFVNQQVAEF